MPVTLEGHHDARDLLLFKKAVDHAADAIVMTDTNAHILYTNDAWEQLTGYQHAEVFGKKPSILKSDKTPAILYERMWRCLSAGETFRTDQLVNIRKDGSEFQAEITIYPLNADDGKTFYVGVQHDISERATAEKLRTDFITLISHQLRTPLTAIRWAMNRLRRSTSDISTEERTLAEMSYAASVTMANTIHAMLLVSRIETGRKHATFSTVDLCRLFERIRYSIEPLVRAKHVAFSADFPTNIAVESDPEILEEILLILLSNAQKYTQEGSITVRAVMQESHVMLSVSDTGVGIPPEERHLIFRKFFRASNARHVSPDGSGLGLYLAQALAEMIDASLTCDDSVSVGTTFTLRIPLHHTVS